MTDGSGHQVCCGFTVGGFTVDGQQKLVNLAFPDIEIAVRLFGSLPERLFTLGDFESTGYIQIHLGFPGGGMAVIDYSRGLPGHADYDSLSVIGSSGAAYADDHHNSHLLYSSDGPRAVLEEGQPYDPVFEVADFARAVRQETKPWVDGEMCLNVLDCLETVIASSSNREPIQCGGEQADD